MRDDLVRGADDFNQFLYRFIKSSTNLKTIEAQRQIIQQNSEAITAQINYLNTLRR